MKTIVIGSGAQGRVVLDLLRAASPNLSVEFLDDAESKWGKAINGAEVKGPISQLSSYNKNEIHVIIAVGNPIIRAKIANNLSQSEIPFTNAIHPSASIAKSALLGADNTILAQAVINSDAVLNKHILINNAAVVEHDTQIEDFVTVSPGAQIGGRVTLKKGCFVGTGAIVLPRLTIGANSVVGAGAVVTKNVPDNVLVFGVPAKVVSEIDANFDWQRLL